MHFFILSILVFIAFISEDTPASKDLTYNENSIAITDTTPIVNTTVVSSSMLSRPVIYTSVIQVPSLAILSLFLVPVAVSFISPDTPLS